MQDFDTKCNNNWTNMGYLRSRVPDSLQWLLPTSVIWDSSTGTTTRGPTTIILEEGRSNDKGSGSDTSGDRFHLFKLSALKVLKSGKEKQRVFKHPYANAFHMCINAWMGHVHMHIFTVYTVYVYACVYLHV